MSLSQRDIVLIFRKRKVTGKDALTSLERGARLLQGPDKKAAPAKSGAKKKKPTSTPRFIIEKKTGLLRSGK